MLNKTKPSHGNRAARAARPALAALALMLGGMSLQAVAQPMASSMGLTAGTPELLCTAGSIPGPGFNQTYGWYAQEDGRLGVLEPGGSDCDPTIPTVLKLDAGGLLLPLAAAVIYDLNVTAPVKPTITIPLLEPALCVDYGTGTGTDSWNLHIQDANGIDMFPSGVKGVGSLDYVLGSGALQPKKKSDSSDNVRLQCYSGLTENASLPSDDGAGNELGPDDIFIDGMESPPAPPSGVDLRVWFPPDLNPGLDVTNNDDVLTQGVDNDAQILVRVQNFGTVAAQNVWVREFVPTSTTLLMPVVTRVGCEYNGDGCSGGTGNNPLNLNIGTLGPGEFRDLVLTRRSSGSPGENQPQALIQIAAFTSSEDLYQPNNSRALRIKVVQEKKVTRSIVTTPTGIGNGGTLTVGQLPIGCDDNGTATTCAVNATGVLTYTATASTGNDGFTFTGFNGSTCNGTETIVTPNEEATYAINVANMSGGNCDLKANFKKKPKLTTQVDGNGSGTINPAAGGGGVTVHVGETVQITATPDNSWSVVEKITTTGTGTGCGSYNPSNPTPGQVVWSTDALQNDCTATATFTKAPVVITSNVVNGTQYVPANGIGVSMNNPGDLVTFRFQANASWYKLDANGVDVSGCGSGAYIDMMDLPDNDGLQRKLVDIHGITQQCTVGVTFQEITHTVRTFVTGNGLGSFQSSQVSLPGTSGAWSIPHGANFEFTLNPEPGYHYKQGSLKQTANSQGSCGTFALAAPYSYNDQSTIPTNETVNISGTVGPIESDGCELEAEFEKNEYTITIKLKDDDGSQDHGELVAGLFGQSGQRPGDPYEDLLIQHTDGSGIEVSFTVFYDGNLEPVIDSQDCNFGVSSPNSNWGNGYTGYRVPPGTPPTADCNIVIKLVSTFGRPDYTPEWAGSR